LRKYLPGLPSIFNTGFIVVKELQGGRAVKEFREAFEGLMNELLAVMAVQGFLGFSDLK
jgi:hypothetical protein